MSRISLSNFDLNSVNGSIMPSGSRSVNFNMNQALLLKNAIEIEQKAILELTNPNPRTVCVDVAIEKDKEVKVQLENVLQNSARYNDLANSCDLEFSLLKNLDNFKNKKALLSLLKSEKEQAINRIQEFNKFIFALARKIDLNEELDKANIDEAKNNTIIMNAVLVNKLCQLNIDFIDKLNLQQRSINSLFNFILKIVELFDPSQLITLTNDMNKLKNDQASNTNAILTQNSQIDTFIKNKEKNFKAIAAQVINSKMNELETRLIQKMEAKINQILDSKAIDNLIKQEENNNHIDSDLYEDIQKQISKSEKGMLEQIKNFTEPNKRLLDSIQQDLEKYKKYNEKDLKDLKGQLLQLREETNADKMELNVTIEQKTIADLDQFKDINKKINDSQESIKQIQNNLDKERAQTNNELKKINNDINMQIRNERKDINESINKLDMLIKTKEENIKVIKNQFVSLSNELTNKLKKFCTNDEIIAIKKANKALETELNNEEKINSQIDRILNLKLKSEIENSKDKIKELDKKLIELETNNKTEILNINNTIKKNKNLVDNLLIQNSKLYKENLIKLKNDNTKDVSDLLDSFKLKYIQGLDDRITEIENNNKDNDEIKEDKSVFDEEKWEKEISELKNKYNSCSNNIISLQQDIKKLNVEDVNEFINSAKLSFKKIDDSKILENNELQNISNNDVKNIKELNKYNLDSWNKVIKENSEASKKYNEKLNTAKSDWNNKIDQLQSSINSFKDSLLRKNEEKFNEYDKAVKQIKETNQEVEKLSIKINNPTIDIQNSTEDINTNVIDNKNNVNTKEIEKEEEKEEEKIKDLDIDVEFYFKNIKDQFGLNYKFDVFHQNMPLDQWKNLSEDQRKEFYRNKNQWKKEMILYLNKLKDNGEAIKAQKIEKLMKFYSDKITGDNIDKDPNNYIILKKSQDKKINVNNSNNNMEKNNNSKKSNKKFNNKRNFSNNNSNDNNFINNNNNNNVKNNKGKNFLRNKANFPYRNQNRNLNQTQNFRRFPIVNKVRLQPNRSRRNYRNTLYQNNQNNLSRTQIIPNNMMNRNQNQYPNLMNSYQNLNNLNLNNYRHNNNQQFNQTMLQNQQNQNQYQQYNNFSNNF